MQMKWEYMKFIDMYLNSRLRLNFALKIKTRNYESLQTALLFKTAPDVFEFS